MKFCAKRGSSCTPVRIHSLATPAIVSRVRDVGQPGRQADRGGRVAGVAGPEALALRRAKEMRAAAQQRPAERDGRVVAAELRLGDAGAVQEELVGVHLLVLEVVAGRSREAVACRLV